VTTCAFLNGNLLKTRSYFDLERGDRSTDISVRGPPAAVGPRCVCLSLLKDLVQNCARASGGRRGEGESRVSHDSLVKSLAPSHTHTNTHTQTYVIYKGHRGSDHYNTSWIMERKRDFRINTPNLQLPASTSVYSSLCVALNKPSSSSSFLDIHSLFVNKRSSSLSSSSLSSGPSPPLSFFPSLS
jgi:hypothetical protein